MSGGPFSSPPRRGMATVMAASGGWARRECGRQRPQNNRCARIYGTTLPNRVTFRIAAGPGDRVEMNGACCEWTAAYAIIDNEVRMCCVLRIASAARYPSAPINVHPPLLKRCDCVQRWWHSALAAFFATPFPLERQHLPCSVSSDVRWHQKILRLLILSVA